MKLHCLASSSRNGKWKPEARGDAANQGGGQGVSSGKTAAINCEGLGESGWI